MRTIQILSFCFLFTIGTSFIVSCKKANIADDYIHRTKFDAKSSEIAIDTILNVDGAVIARVYMGNFSPRFPIVYEIDKNGKFMIIKDIYNKDYINALKKKLNICMEQDIVKLFSGIYFSVEIANRAKMRIEKLDISTYVITTTLGDSAFLKIKDSNCSLDVIKKSNKCLD